MRVLSYIIRESIIVQLTSCLQTYLFGWIKTSQTGGHLYSDISRFEVSEYSLVSDMDDIAALMFDSDRVEWVEGERKNER